MSWKKWLGFPEFEGPEIIELTEEVPVALPPNPPPPPAAAEPVEPRPRDYERVDFHIRRFTLALEQCQKGPERRAELERNLEYWLAVKKLKNLRDGGTD